VEFGAESESEAEKGLSPDSEVIDVNKLAPEGHGIAQDVEDILDADHMCHQAWSTMRNCHSNKRGPAHLNHHCLGTKARVMLGHRPRTV
jgi:hypothetical protein